MSNVHNHGLEEALTSENPIVRVVARAGASRWTEEMAAWTNAEIAQGTKPAHLLEGMIVAFIKTHSGIVAQFVEPEFFDEVAELFKQFIDDEYVHHAGQVFALLAKRSA